MHKDPHKTLSWQKFASQVRNSDKPMLKNLDDFPNSILVTGCQRSGTTALTRVITSNEQIASFKFSEDDERDGALILSGIADHLHQNKRYCFQTTYLNERYTEYFSARTDQKIIWILRNPFSVVYSLLHNWWNFGINELFMGCGTDIISEKEKKWFNLLGHYGISRLHKACYAYSGKSRQIYEIYKKQGKENFLIVEYDEMIKQKNTILPKIFSFIDLPYRKEYADALHSKSINIKKKLSQREKDAINKICYPAYMEALSFLDKNF